MDKYELKKELVNLIRKTNALSVCDTSSLLLSHRKINNYNKISPGNGKLNFLHNLIFGDKHQNKTHLLLWIPASNPYYKAGGLFENEFTRNFSKIILFSSWEMVPRMVSVMISYYSELYTLGELKKDIPELRYVSKKKNRYGENRLRNDNLLEYPCKTLASLYTPKEYFGEKISNIKRSIRNKIASLLENNEQIRKLTKKSRGSAKSILSIMMLLDNKKVENTDDLYLPLNTLEVLTDIAIASPAVCAYRQSYDIDDATKVGNAIVSVFNKPESAAVIDLIYNKKSGSSSI